MKHLTDKHSIDSMLEQSNLKFFSSGVLNVNDPLFITKWNLNSKVFQSEIFYSNLENEAFSMSLDESDLISSWNKFGINQSLGSNGIHNAPYHRNKHIEIHYVKSGTFTLKVNQTIITLNKGDVCIINPHCYHSDIINDDSLELYIIGINKDVVGYEQIKHHPLFDTAFVSNNKTSEYIISRQIDDASVNLEAMCTSIKDHESNQDLVDFIDSIFKQDYEHIKEVETSRNTMLFEELNIFINRNFRTITLEDLEFYFNFSKDYMSRIIKEQTGLSFKKFVQDIRIDKAKALLIQSSDPIKDIMNAVGYKNETHFYKLFKELVGVLPNEYRETQSE